MTKQAGKLPKKVAALLARACARRLEEALWSPNLDRAREGIREALRRRFGDEAARSIAFHLMDWTSEAAFLLALAMFPDQFSKSEVSEEADALLVHVPNHIAAAAKISGNRCEDIWGESPADRPIHKKRPAKRCKVRRKPARP